jgi:glucokinase
VQGGRAIGVDIGGTKILAGIVDRAGNVEGIVERPTPLASQDAWIDALVETVAQLQTPDVVAVGAGAPVRIDIRTDVALAAVNLPLRPFPLEALLAERTGLPASVVNDASAAAYAEYALGAGRGSNDLVLITLGTGVGGGLVLGGKLYRGWSEVGHMVIVEGGEPCQGSCTGHGHVESYCSGTAADRVARDVLGPQATAHDLVAQRHPALAQIGRHLGSAVASLQNLFDPDVVLIGGGFGVAAGGALIDPIRSVIAYEALTPAAARVRLAVAELGHRAGMIGAALIALDAAA